MISKTTGIKVGAVFMAVALLCGCATTRTDRTYDPVRIGMSMEEVTAALGPVTWPGEIRRGETGHGSSETWYYRWPFRSGWDVSFDNGRVWSYEERQ